MSVAENLSENFNKTQKGETYHAFILEYKHPCFCPILLNPVDCMAGFRFNNT